MADEQFNLQLPEMPQESPQEISPVTGQEFASQAAPVTDQIQYASPQAPVGSYTAPFATSGSASTPTSPEALTQSSIPSPLQYATPGYTYVTNPNSLQEKLKLFFTKPLGKIILFTLLFLGIAGMIMYSTNSVGLKGSFVEQTTGKVRYVVGKETILATSELDKNVWVKAKVENAQKKDDGTYDYAIIYESDKKTNMVNETQTAPLDVHPTANFIKKGAQFIAESQFSPGKFYSITIKQLNGDGTVTATTNDDQTEYNKLELKNIYIPGGDPANIVILGGSSGVIVGSKVLGNWESNTNRWSQATITKVNSDGTYDIIYDDGDIKNNRKKSQIVDFYQKQPDSVKSGQIVVYKHPDKNEWYNALIYGDEKNPTQAILVGVDGEKNQQSNIAKIDLQNVYLTLEGYKELDGKAFTGDLTKPPSDSSSSPTVTSFTVTPTQLLPGETGVILIKGTNLKGLTLSGTDMTFLAHEPLANNDTSYTAKVYVELTAKSGARDIVLTNEKKQNTTQKNALTVADSGLSVGAKVLGNWKSQPFKWSQATITKINTDSTFNISYGPNDDVNNLPITSLAPLATHPSATDLKIGSQVVAASPNTAGAYYTSTVKKINASANPVTLDLTTNDDQTLYAALTLDKIFIPGGDTKKIIVTVPENKPPLAPTWNAPAPTAELSTTDLAKTEFKWTAGLDPDSAPSKTPNYQFAIIKGEITDQSEIGKIFSGTAAEANKKYDLAWIVRWTEKPALEEMQKLINLNNCIADIGGGNVAFICNKFIIPSNIQSLMKEGQKYTAIVQQGDGEKGSPYAVTTFSLKKQEDCPADQYFITDSKNSGCKKIPNFKGAFAQAGFICGLYKTILTNPDNSYRLNDDTKTNLQASLDTQCSKKPDAVTNTCLTKMTYIPKGKTLCEPLKIITDPLLSKDVCEQYTSEKDNKSLSPDTTKQITTILAGQCKPKICPTGKFLNGPSVPENCAAVMTFPTKLSNYDTTKACNTMKKIAESTLALATYQIDQPTFDQIKLTAASEGCNPKQQPAAPVTEDKPKDQTADTKITDTKTSDPATCSKGYYLPLSTTPAVSLSTAKDCKKLPDLIMLTSITDIGDACKLYKDLTSGKLDGKLDAPTTLQVKDFSQNVLCDQAITSTPSAQTAPVQPLSPAAPVAFESADSAPPSLSMPSKKPLQTNVLSSVASEAPPSLSFTPTSSAPAQTLIEDYIPPSKPSRPATPSKPRYYEPLPKPQTTNYQPAHPVAGSYVPRATAKTGPEMWIYSFGLAFATIGSRKWKKKSKNKK